MTRDIALTPDSHADEFRQPATGPQTSIHRAPNTAGRRNDDMEPIYTMRSDCANGSKRRNLLPSVLGRLPREPCHRLRPADQRQELRHLGPGLARGERETQRMEERP